MKMKTTVVVYVLLNEKGTLMSPFDSISSEKLLLAGNVYKGT